MNSGIVATKNKNILLFLKVPILRILICLLSTSGHKTDYNNPTDLVNRYYWAFLLCR